MGVMFPPESKPVVLPPWCDVAKSAYAAYTACIDKDGITMPWEQLPAEYRAAWEAAVRQASYVLRGDGTAVGIESRWRGWKPMPVSSECN